MKFNDMFTKFKSKFLDKILKNRKVFILVLVLIVCLFSYVILFSANSEDGKAKTQTESIQQNSSSDYASNLQSKIKSMLLNISEVTKADVMVVCDSTEIYDYLKNHEESKSENGSSTIRDEVVYQKDGSSTSPIIISSKMPKVVGVWIIVNSISASTKLAITNSIKSVLNIDESCISILQER